LFAFYVMLNGGAQTVVRDAVGFVIMEKEYVGEAGKVSKQAVMVFCDRNGNGLGAIPLDMVHLAIFIPDDRLI
jgi:hypothetical protein